MPKLVTKYDLPPPSAQEKFTSLVQTILSVVLIIVALLAIVLFSYVPTKPTANLLAATPTEVNIELPPTYTKATERLATLTSAFEQNELAAQEHPTLHSELVTRIETILQQLESMDDIVERMPLAAKDKQNLLANQQYQKDYWEAKRIFHETRLARLKSDTKVPEVQPAKNVDQALKQVASTNVTEPVIPETVIEVPPPAPSTDKSAAPVKLPADFCPLFGPNAGSCKINKKH